MVVGLRLGLLVFPVVSGWFAWGNGRAALLGWNAHNSTNFSNHPLPRGRSVQVIPLRDTPRSRGLPGGRTGPTWATGREG